MKKIGLFLLVFIIFSLSNVQATEMGLIVGEPTGLSLKAWQSSNQAFDLALGWSLAKDNQIYLHFDYLLHNPSGIHISGGHMPFYYGFGARAITGNSNKMGIRLPLGIELIHSGNPLRFFAEIVPLLNLAPASSVEINGALGLRYNFN